MQLGQVAGRLVPLIWISPRMETPQPLWVTLSAFDLPPQWKNIFFNQSFFFSSSNLLPGVLPTLHLWEQPGCLLYTLSLDIIILRQFCPAGDKIWNWNCNNMKTAKREAGRQVISASEESDPRSWQRVEGKAWKSYFSSERCAPHSHIWRQLLRTTPSDDCKESTGWSHRQPSVLCLPDILGAQHVQ